MIKCFLNHCVHGNTGGNGQCHSSALKHLKKQTVEITLWESLAPSCTHSLSFLHAPSVLPSLSHKKKICKPPFSVATKHKNVYCKSKLLTLFFCELTTLNFEELLCHSGMNSERFFVYFCSF